MDKGNNEVEITSWISSSNEKAYNFFSEIVEKKFPLSHDKIKYDSHYVSWYCPVCR